MSPANHKPKINLYRNISISFVVVTVMLLFAVSLLFSGRAVIRVTVNENEMNLSFNAQVKENPATAELSDQDVIAGKVITEEKDVEAGFDVLSTKSSSAENVGSVRLENHSKRDQTLVKTTQLQAANGVIVRTSEAAVVPAGSSIVVGVYPKDPASFSAIEPGRLTIIKLSSSLQPDIYGTAEQKLIAGPHEVKVLSDSDVARAKQEIVKQIAAGVKKDLGISDGSGISVEVIQANPVEKIGTEVDKFTLKTKLKIQYLDINREQLLSLVQKKISNLSLDGMVINSADLANVNYEITSIGTDNTALIKVIYVAKAKISTDNELFNKDHFTGKTIEEVRQYFSGQETIRNVEVLLTPYWKNVLPKQQSKINIIIQ